MSTNGHTACRYHRLPTEPRCTVAWESTSRPVSIRCTRPAGHTGDHVACGKVCLVARWKDVPEGAEVQAQVARLLLSGTVVAA